MILDTEVVLILYFRLRSSYVIFSMVHLVLSLGSEETITWISAAKLGYFFTDDVILGVPFRFVDVLFFIVTHCIPFSW